MADISRYTYVDGGFNNDAFAVDNSGGGSNQLMLVFVTRQDGAVPSAVTFNSSSLTLIAEYAGGESGRYISIWRLYAPAHVNASVGVNWSSSPTFSHHAAVVYDNVHQTLGIHATNTGTVSSSPTCTITSGSISTGGCWLVGFTQQDSNTAVANSGCTLLVATALRSSSFDSNGTVSTGTPSFSAKASDGVTNNNWRWIAVAIRPTAVSQNISGSVASSGTLIKSTSRALTGGITPAGTVAKSIRRALTGAVSSITGTLVKQVNRLLTGSVTSAGTLSALKIVLKSLSGSVASAGTLVRSISRTLTGSVSPTGTVTKSIRRTLTGAVTSSAIVIKSTTRSLTGAVASAGTLVTSRLTLKLLTGTVAISGVLTKRINRALTGTVTPTGVVLKLTKRALTGIVAIAGALTTRIINEATTITTIGGTPWSIQYDTLEIEDLLNDAPNQCTFQTRVRPTEGQIISVTRGVNSTLEFYGNILTVQQVSQELPENLLFFVTAQDMTWKFNRRLITQRWENVSASTIAANIIDNWTSGFTRANVVGSLATVPEFECVLEKPTAALARLAAIIGGNFYIDYSSDLHFFLTESSAAPDDLLVTTPFADLQYQADLTQIKTRIKAVGGGSTAAIDLTPGATTAPVDTATPFEAGGGSFISGANIGAYTGKHDGGVGSKVAGNVSSPGSSAPFAALSTSGVGKVVGSVNYKVAFANGQGETIPGNASNSVTGAAFTAPGGATINAGSTLGRLIGAYSYRFTYLTALGETDGGTIFSRTAVATSAPSTPSIGLNASMGKLIGNYGYRITFESAYGESPASIAGTRTAAVTSGPTAPSSLSANVTAGPLKGSYTYKLSLVGPTGAESLSTATSSITVTGHTPDTPSISSTGASTISVRVSYFHELYGETGWGGIATDASSSSPVNISWVGIPGGCGAKIYSTGTGHPSTDPFYLVATLPSGTTSYVHTTASGPLAESPKDTMGKTVSMSIATGPSGTIARRVYRTKDGGSTYFLVAEIGDNSTTSFTDNVPDSALTVGAPVQNLNGESNTVTIATGPTGTLRRKIYRTEAGGSNHYLLRTIEDNSTTSFVDNDPDTQLNKSLQAPASSTSGDQHAITSIPTGPAGTLGRKIYRTTAGGSSYQFLTELTDNVTTSYTDNKADSELGDFIPLVNSAGANQVNLTSIPLGGSGVTQRILYRLAADGTYKYLDTINDNSTSTYTDNKADSELGRPALTVGTIGASIGDTTLTLLSALGLPTEGWVAVDSLLVHYTSISGSTLTGIPGPRTISSLTRSGSVATAVTSGAHGFVTGTTVTIQNASQIEYNGSPKITVTGSTTFTYPITPTAAASATGASVLGPGALLSAIAGDTPVVSAPFLYGVSGISYAINRGNEVLLYTVRNDATAQSTLATLEGGDGIHEDTIRDTSIITLTGLNAAADAELNNYKSKIPSIAFESRDVKLKSGKTIPVNLSDARNIVGSFLIQRVVSSKYNFNRTTLPLRRVDAAPIRVTWQDIVKRQSAKEITQ